MDMYRADGFKKKTWIPACAGMTNILTYLSVSLTVRGVANPGLAFHFSHGIHGKTRKSNHRNNGNNRRGKI